MYVGSIPVDPIINKRLSYDGNGIRGPKSSKDKCSSPLDHAYLDRSKEPGYPMHFVVYI